MCSSSYRVGSDTELISCVQGESVRKVSSIDRLSFCSTFYFDRDRVRLSSLSYLAITFSR